MQCLDSWSEIRDIGMFFPAVNGQAYKGKGKKELPASPFDVPIPLATSVPAYPTSNATGNGTVGKADSFSFQPGASRISGLFCSQLLSCAAVLSVVHNLSMRAREATVIFLPVMQALLRGQ